MIKFAVRIYGENRKLLVGANYISALSKYLNYEAEFYVYATKDNELNKMVLNGIKGIKHIGKENTWSEVRYEDYDIVLAVDVFPMLEYYNTKTCKNWNIEQLIDAWTMFRKDDKNTLFFQSRKRYRPYAYSRIAIQGKSILNALDIGSVLKMKRIYDLPFGVNKNVESVLEKYKLKNQKYITFQCKKQSTLSLDIKLLDKITTWIKTTYPEIKIVQLGEKGYQHNIGMFADEIVVDNASWAEIRVVLENAVIHIDGDSFLTQLRTAIGVFPSIVIFGATPMEILADERNNNINSNMCKHWCMSLREDWEYYCIKSGNEPVCLCSDQYENIKNNVKKILDERIML